MYIRRSRSVLLSHSAIGYPDVKCRRTERPPLPSGCKISRCKMSAHGIRENHTRLIAYLIWICCPDALRWYIRTPCSGILLVWFPKNSPQSHICFGDQKAIKTPKLNTIWLELIAMVLNMLIELKGNNYYSRVFKKVNYKLQNNTFWVVISTPKVKGEPKFLQT